MRLQKSLVLFVALIFSAFLVKSQSYTINGNTLTTTDKVQISIGSYIRYVKPANNQANFSSIYSEINLRSTSDGNLPKGVGADQAGKEMKVRKFYERKVGRTTKAFLIVGGGVFNQAIDIDKALNSGEVLVQRPASDLSATPTPTAKPGIFNSPLRFPWTKTPPTPMDSSKWLVSKQKSQDSLKALAKVKKDSSLAKPMVKTTIIADNPVVVKPQPTTIPVASNPIANIPQAKPEALNNPVNDNRGLEVQPNPITSVPVATNPVVESAPLANEPAHSVSSLLTLHPVESPKSDKADGNSTKESKGYDKYNKLKQLKELYDQGILNKEEFDAEKKKILAGN
jgi:hypothetical protein